MFCISREARAITALGVALIGGAAVWRGLRENTPIFVTGWDVADPVKAGDPEAAMEHSRKLLALLKRNNWSIKGIPFAWFQLPDRKFAEDPALRGDKVSSYALSWPGEPEYGFDDVAFTSWIYMRQNTKQYKGGVSRSKPSGFTIVGFKDGRVVKVKPEDIRMVARPGDGKVVQTYPGMKIYDPNGARLHYIEDSAPEQPALLAAAVSKIPIPKPKPTPCAPVQADPNAPCRK